MKVGWRTEQIDRLESVWPSKQNTKHGGQGRFVNEIHSLQILGSIRASLIPQASGFVLRTTLGV